jgi:hypothetical protein
MLTEYEAWVITKSRMKGYRRLRRSRSVTGAVAGVGLILIGILMFSTMNGRVPSSRVINLGAVVQPANNEADGVAP